MKTNHQRNYKDKDGAKKYVNSRERFHSNQHLQKQIKEGFDDEH